ncbi:hypothetical protein [Caballeronia sp. RCC_10]|uniref:hypothetical protein n=1 Tax=Caballeronia sp. RCC_10 TaxID=3239227 RepID=UPI003526912E
MFIRYCHGDAEKAGGRVENASKTPVNCPDVCVHDAKRARKTGRRGNARTTNDALKRATVRILLAFKVGFANPERGWRQNQPRSIERMGDAFAAKAWPPLQRFPAIVAACSRTLLAHVGRFAGVRRTERRNGTRDAAD